jgi:hypothetical protein
MKGCRDKGIKHKGEILLPLQYSYTPRMSYLLQAFVSYTEYFSTMAAEKYIYISVCIYVDLLAENVRGRKSYKILWEER